VKPPFSDSCFFHEVDLEKKYVNEVRLKIDNRNNRFLVNSFFYKKNRGTVEGLFSWCWDNSVSGKRFSVFTEFSDSLRAESRKDGRLRNAFDEFVIRQTFMKKDGGYLLLTEDASSQSGNSNTNPYYYSPYNRWGSFNSPYSIYPNSFYYYNPYVDNYYRPYSGFGAQSIRFFYANIVVISIDPDGRAEWTRVIPKDQMDDNDDNFLSYTTMISGGEVHLLFNLDKRNQVITDEGIAPDGSNRRHVTLKSQEKGYQFMPRLGKQVGAGELLIPCQYRGYICFAKAEL
jgi:hypothetical protein